MIRSKFHSHFDVCVPGDYGRSYFTSIAAVAVAAAAAADVVVSGYKSQNRLGSSRDGFPLTQISCGLVGWWVGVPSLFSF